MKSMIAALFVFLVTVIYLNAADINWTNLSGTNDWNTGGNWDAGVPTASDNALVTTDPSGASYGVEVGVGDSNDIYRLQAGVSDGKRLNINVLGSLVANNETDSDGDYGLQLNGNTTLNIASGGYLYVKAQTTAGASTNHIIIGDGGEIAYTTPINLRRRFKFRGTLDVYGKMTVLNPNALGIENYDDSTDKMNIYSTAQVNVSDIIVPLYVYDNTNVICYGAEKLRHITNSVIRYGREYGGRYRTYGFILAGGDTANIYNSTLTPLQAGSVSSNYFNSEIYGLRLGQAAGGNAASTLNLYQGSVMELYANIYISVRPSAAINIYGGSSIRTLSDVYCGSVDGSYILTETGTLNIDNGYFYTTNVATNATIYIGNLNNGVLNVGSSGHLQADTVKIGNNSPATGTFSINGGEADISNGFIVTNGTLATININSGTLNVAGADLTLGSALIVGDGSNSATFGLTGSGNTISDGLIITNQAKFAAGGVGIVDDSVALTADMVFCENSIIHCDLDNGTYDKLTLTGDLKLPAVASVELNALSSNNLPDVIELISASTTSGATDLSGWTVGNVGEVGYSASLNGTVLTLSRIEKGTCIILK